MAGFKGKGEVKDVKRKSYNKPITSTSIIRFAQVLNSKTNRKELKN